MICRDAVLGPRGLRLGNRILPCTIGQGGIATSKREGDGATPAGVHRITGCLYRPDRLAPPAPWARPIRPRDIWSDDPDDPAYNRLARAPSPFSHEALRRPDPLYDVIVLTDWNAAPPRPGQGSAIFLHRWRKPGHPTAGCIALSPADLVWLIAHIRPGTRLTVHPRTNHLGTNTLAEGTPRSGATAT